MTNRIDMAWMLAERQHQGQDYGPFGYMKHIKDCDELLEIMIEHFRETERIQNSYPSFGEDDDLCLDDHMSEDFYITIKCTVRLHDVLEDGNISFNDLKLYFSPKIAEAVYSVTDDLGKNRAERKNYARIKANKYGRIAKLIDRLANSTNSKQTKSSMFKKYKQEHKDFKQNLLVGENEIHIFETYLWEELDNLFK